MRRRNYVVNDNKRSRLDLELIADLKAKEESASNDNDQSVLTLPIFCHQWIDARDKYGHWYEAQITEIDRSNKTRFKIHYKGWQSSHDEWMDLNSLERRQRICDLHSHTPRLPLLGKKVVPKIGLKCDCLDATDVWCAAEIMQIGSDLSHQLLKVHYLNWSKVHDEWIHIDSYRLSPLHTHTANIEQHMTAPFTTSEIIQFRDRENGLISGQIVASIPGWYKISYPLQQMPLYRQTVWLKTKDIEKKRNSDRNSTSSNHASSPSIALNVCMSSNTNHNEQRQKQEVAPSQSPPQTSNSQRAIVDTVDEYTFDCHMSFEEANKLAVGDQIDHRAQGGQFMAATVIDKRDTNLKIHYDGRSQFSDTWSDYALPFRFAKRDSICKRVAHRFSLLQSGDYVDINPRMQHGDCGWTYGEIVRRRLDAPHNSGQVQVVYNYQQKSFLYWSHLDNAMEIAEFTTKTTSESGAAAAKSKPKPPITDYQKESKCNHNSINAAADDNKIQDNNDAINADNNKKANEPILLESESDLASHPGQQSQREQIISALLGMGFTETEGYVDYVLEIRKKKRLSLNTQVLIQLIFEAVAAHQNNKPHNDEHSSNVNAKPVKTLPPAHHGPNSDDGKNHGYGKNEDDLNAEEGLNRKPCNHEHSSNVNAEPAKVLPPANDGRDSDEDLNAEESLNTEERVVTLTAKEKGFKQYFFSNVKFAQKYYQSFVDNGYNDLEIVLELDVSEIDVLVNECGMNRLHAKHLLTKISHLKQENEVFRRFFVSRLNIHQYYEMMSNHGILSFQMFDKQFEHVTDLIDFVGIQKMTDAITIWNEWENEKQKPSADSNNKNM